MTTIRTALAGGLAAAAALAATTVSSGQAPARRDFDAEIRTAVQAAKTAAGFDFLGTLARTCLLPQSGGDDTRDTLPGFVTNPSSAPPRDTWYAEPAKVFDDLYFVGGKVHSSWALTTSDGIIVIDTIYPYNSEELIVGGLQKLGLDPKNIKYVIISHAHGDHIGGAEMLQTRYGARVVMGGPDWDLVAKYPNRYKTMAPKRDVVATDGMKITLGGKTVTIWLTPGHTPGTLSYTFPVLDRGKPVPVAYSGGTAFNFVNNTPDPGIRNFQTYIESQQHIASRAAAAGATVLLSNHSEFDEAVKKNRMLAGRGTGPHPYDVGTDAVQRYFQVMQGCARAAQLRLEQRRAEGPAAQAAAPRAPERVAEIPFDSVPDFLKLPAGMNFGEVSGVAVNSRGHVFVFTRSNSANGPAYAPAAAQLLEFGPKGEFLREIGRGLYGWAFAHTVRIDKADNIWAVDKGSDMVIRFNPAGQVTMVFGRRRESADPETEPWDNVDPPRPAVDGLFRQPTDVAWDSQGNTYISDGYINSRIAKYDSNGDWVTSWGDRGTAPGQFRLPHAIAVDRDDHVYVGDRSNRRIQVFDADGRFLRMFTIDVPPAPGTRAVNGNTPAGERLAAVIGAPNSICIPPGSSGVMFVGESTFPGRIFKVSLDGRVLGVIGRSGRLLKQFSGAHQLACPTENELYVAETSNWRVQKLLLRPTAAPTGR